MVEGSLKTRRPYYHFSVDDVFGAFVEVSDRQLSLFDHPFFRFLKDIHEEFKASVSLYLFYQENEHGRMRTLAEVSDANKNVLRENQWLQLGPHALDGDTPPHTQDPAEQVKIFDAIYQEIERFSDEGGRSKWVRLHYFSESYELAEYFKRRGVEALLSTDKEAVSYRLPALEKERLKNEGSIDYQGMTFVRTHLRVETLVDKGVPPNKVYEIIEPTLDRLGYIVLMTHEYELSRPEVRAMTASTLRCFKDHGISSL